MVYASRSRMALSPVPQNQSSDLPSQPSISKSGRIATSQIADRTRRSDLGTKLAHASSALLRSPSLANQVSCFVELPVAHPSPSSTHFAQVRAGLKRKKGSREQLGRGGNRGKIGTRQSEGVDVSSSAHTLKRNGSRRNKELSAIIASPHTSLDKPSSSASELSEWSSVVSISPTSSRAPTSITEETVAQTRPGIQTRRSSRSSLHRTLDHMTLDDALPIGLGIHRSSRSSRSRRSQSQAVSRQSSNHTSGTVDHWLRQRRTLEVSMASDSDHSSNTSGDMDSQEAEHARLISSAPTWQLHRLRKDELVQLCSTASAWEDAPIEEELELMTKQDLVNQIITCRSRLDRSQSNHRQASGSNRPHRSRQSFDLRSDDMLGEDVDSNDALWMGSSNRRASRRVSQRFIGTSPANSSDHEADLSDASNEAGGEETEAETHHPPSTRRISNRSLHGRVKTGGALRRMDSSTFDELEPSKINQETRRRLRDKNSLRSTIGRRLRIANGSEALSASTSSSIFGGRSSRASNTSHSPFLPRRLNVFVASSPIRTRSRTARLTMGMPIRRKAGTTGDAASPSRDPMATPKLGNRELQREAKKSVKFNATPSNEGEDEWIEDVSRDSEVAPALRNDSPRSLDESKNTRRVLRARHFTADSDTSLNWNQPRSRSPSIEMTSELEVEMGMVEQDGDADVITSDDDAPTPTKFRKLRNGKLRLIAGSAGGGSEVHTPEGEQVDDVDMESASECAPAGRGRDQRTESPERDTAPSESIENTLFQPTFTALSRLRKSELEQLCQHSEIVMDEDDKKANLIKKLLDWHQLTELEAANADGAKAEAQDDEEVDGGETCSEISTAYATADHEPFETAQRTPTRKRTTRAASNTHAAATDSDQPLLLRALGKAVSSDKLPTPPLTSNNDEANPPQAGDGVDELNGLDLESLNLTDKEIPPSKLEKLEKIGSGGFKDVYVGKYRISKTRVNKVAIADIRDQLTEMDIKELSLLRDLRHENIVRFIGVSIPEDPRHVPCMIVSELCSNGDLFDYIRNTPTPSDTEVFRILLETARGLEYLHTRSPPIVHRDCKSTNVLITRRKTAKINDFGLARVKNTSRSMMRSLVGTVNWQAVELWVPKPHYDEKVDVWSAAMTFWEALQWHQPEKKYPFQGMNEHQIYQDVGQKKQRPYTGFIRRQFGGEIVDLLDRMWDHNPKNRPSMTEVCDELESLIRMKKEAARGRA
ncbi:uncharacterized protein MEPE_02582 [Melanopsichium pennsylvanicum]|uniref:Protein kinase domain-containing protein n=2 Tax=Melanopsichium pennsylvanicum TaxID=63383 RepID=A0AAJ4XJM9_9BASI|nr:kinase-like protein [Melanopsichium pennsylvanicum 4]SNX83874.1 uncharacterized protein MEPE_02582 [Melanopsichium pennsylvanicum]